MKNKIIIFLGLIATILTGSINSVNAITLDGLNQNILNNPNDGKTEMVKAFGDNYEEFLEDNWNKVEIAGKVESLMKDNYKDSYPSYYGGMYISDDAQNLVIQIVEKNIPSEESEEYPIYNKIINIDSSIKIVYVNYSYNELNAVNNKIIEYFNSDKADMGAFENFSSNYIDIMNNTVVIELENNTNEKQAIFKQVVLADSKQVLTSSKQSLVDSKYIVFKKGEPARTTINLNPGGLLYVHGGTCSMAFRVKYNNEVGYVTAGHCFKGLYPLQTGTLKLWHFANNSSGDYAFVATNGTYDPTNTLEYTAPGITQLAVVNFCPTLITNMAVAKVGDKTHYTAGKITDTSRNVKYKTGTNSYTTINDLAVAEMTVNCGDSGGAVFISRTDANGGAIPVGIVSGGNPSEDCSVAGNTTYFTNFNLLPTALQEGRY